MVGEYERLRAAIEREIDPKSIFDKIRVRDLTDKVWEERRLKRSQAALIESALVQSLAMLFAPPTVKISKLRLRPVRIITAAFQKRSVARKNPGHSSESRLNKLKPTRCTFAVSACKC